MNYHSISLNIASMAYISSVRQDVGLFCLLITNWKCCVGGYVCVECSCTQCTGTLVLTVLKWHPNGESAAESVSNHKYPFCNFLFVVAHCHTVFVGVGCVFTFLQDEPPLSEIRLPLNIKPGPHSKPRSSKI
jgi:hypothetical protein